MIAVSIISHGHGAMLGPLVEQLLEFPEVTRIIVTKNIPESLVLPKNPRLLLLENSMPGGFGSNHNAAFRHCRESYFCPLNPDVTFDGNPFPGLLDVARATGACIVAPRVDAPDGHPEDSMRFFPTPSRLVRKLLRGERGSYTLSRTDEAQAVEWVAGMFMLFCSEQYRQLGGFDERYHLYYEDADICTRAWRHGLPVIGAPKYSVIHDARRDSHRNLRHLLWHLSSMTRYFAEHWGDLPDIHPQQQAS